MLDKETRHYIRKVLRLGEGAPVLLFDGLGREAEGVIEHLSEKEGRIKVLGVWSVPQDSPSITLAQSLPKSGKMDLVLQKATELGVCRIIPFLSARSIARPEAGKSFDRRERWQKIVIEAARQCRRAHIPEGGRIASFSEMAREAPANAIRIILWEGEMSTGMKVILQNNSAQHAVAYFIVIGPEGGFTEEEIREARDQGFLTAHLGRHILRTETAAIAAIIVIQYEVGTFFGPGGGEPRK